jgi:hypothetical protein
MCTNCHRISITKDIPFCLGSITNNNKSKIIKLKAQRIDFPSFYKKNFNNVKCIKVFGVVQENFTVGWMMIEIGHIFLENLEEISHFQCADFDQ